MRPPGSANSDSPRSARPENRWRSPRRNPPTRAADKLHEAVTHFEAADDEPMRAQAAYSLAYLQYDARDEWAAAVRATEIATEAYKASDDEAGVHNAAILRAAAEIQLAGAMNAGTQRAEQRAMYAAADRRLADGAEFFKAHGRCRCWAQYAVNMRAVLAVSIGDYAGAGTLLAQSVEMARANNDVVEQAKSLANLAAVHTYLGFIAQAAKEYEALLPLIDAQAQPYQYAVLLGNYGFTLIALGDFDRALALHTQALEALHEDRRGRRARSRTGRAGRTLFPHGRRRTRTRNAASRDHRTGTHLGHRRHSRARCASPPMSPRCSVITRRRSAICASRRESMRIHTPWRAPACSSRRSCARPATWRLPRRNWRRR